MRLPPHVTDFIEQALEEDMGSGDITTNMLVPEGHASTARLVAKSGFVLAGLPVAREVFMRVNGSLVFNALREEGSKVRRSEIIAEITGSTRSLFSGERVALNFLQRLSGIATLTNSFVRKTEGFKTGILDTRKTTPGMRYLEKYAVRTGGGRSHRMGLYDGILIKDNHIRAAGGVGKAVKLARKGSHLLKIEVEAETLEEVKEALSSGADVIMLDNMPLEEIKKAVRLARGKAVLEAVGALTHSAPAVDISMELL
jgi:nicotinate-nucleotide pyrophosphorylase (carboxylating)